MIEGILADFRRWFAENASAEPEPPRPASEPPDWSSVLQQWIALRQEVNLQTKATRSLMEQSADILAQFEAPAPADPSEQVLRPVLKAIVEAHDALTLARRELQKLQVPASPAAAPPTPTSSWWPWSRRTVPPNPVSPAAGEDYQARLQALLAGYQMSVQRLERLIAQQGLEPIACVGEPFDPETMEVIEVHREAGRVASEVLEEVRRGYQWRGRLFRLAQVRVARPL